jgi:hypothetical protein
MKIISGRQVMEMAGKCNLLSIMPMENFGICGVEY